MLGADGTIGRDGLPRVSKQNGLQVLSNATSCDKALGLKGSSGTELETQLRTLEKPEASQPPAKLTRTER